MGISNALRLAKVILNGFDAFFGDFQNVTLGAQARFEQADWLLVHALVPMMVYLLVHCSLAFL